MGRRPPPSNTLLCGIYRALGNPARELDLRCRVLARNPYLLLGLFTRERNLLCRQLTCKPPLLDFAQIANPLGKALP
jgi:hypothetical protein